MAVYLKRLVELTIGRDSALSKVLINESQQQSNSTQTEAVTGQVEITAGATFQIPLASIATARALLLISTSNLELRYGAADNDPIPVQPIATDQIGVAYIETSATSIFVKNVSATTATLAYAVAGT